MKYTEAFEIASIAKREIEYGGRAFYRDGVLRRAALAAVGKSHREAIASIVQTFDANLLRDTRSIQASRCMINKSWDGSVA